MSVKDYEVGDVVHFQGKVYHVFCNSFKLPNSDETYIGIEDMVTFNKVVFEAKYIDRKTPFKVVKEK